MSIYSMRTVVSPKVRNPDKSKPKAIKIPRTEGGYAQMMMASINEKPSLVRCADRREKHKSSNKAAGKNGGTMSLPELRREAILETMQPGSLYKARDLEEIISNTRPDVAMSKRALAANLDQLRTAGKIVDASTFRDAGGNPYALWKKI